ncbi:hypothetical protein [Propionispira arboris]
MATEREIIKVIRFSAGNIPMFGLDTERLLLS